MGWQKANLWRRWNKEICVAATCRFFRLTLQSLRIVHQLLVVFLGNTSREMVTVEPVVAKILAIQ